MMTAPIRRRGRRRKDLTAAKRISQDRQEPAIGAEAKEFPGSTIHHISADKTTSSSPGAA